MWFMSAEHVAAMNEILRDAEEVRAACARLRRPRVLAYRLTDGPDGADVHWTVTVADTVRFALTEASDPDVRLVGDWTRMIGAAEAARDGSPADPAVSVAGDAAALAEIGTALDVARSVATMPVEFPVR